jgi:transcriptional regulator with XRE-family HTH domain
MTGLREVRVNRLFSLRDLAEEAGVAPSTVYLIEAGRSTPRRRVVQRLAAALEVEPSDIDEFQRTSDRSQLVSRPRVPPRRPALRTR